MTIAVCRSGTEGLCYGISDRNLARRIGQVLTVQEVVGLLHKFGLSVQQMEDCLYVEFAAT